MLDYLGFIHPRTKEYMEFEAPLPQEFEDLLDTFAKKKLTNV